ncbi:hypothetical protein T459_05524 [Capsicum annuum]|uniref:Secreted protein n=1 Tax=Capsicum annuum TaxID=4072 RepID=A0A2G3A887_CAPAN|nr:hypothetical protein T459_05524 [Capsicum annuum]
MQISSSISLSSLVFLFMSFQRVHILEKQRFDDTVGVAAKKRQMAHYKLPWSTSTKEREEMGQTLKWRRKHVAPVF